MSRFPAKIWDGTSMTRDDPLTRKGPDGEDWKTITKQLQATQSFVVNLAVNAENMPDLVVEIKKFHNQLSILQSEAAQLTIPEDVILQVYEISEKMAKLQDVYTHAAEVLQTVNLLQRQLLNLGKRIDEHAQEAERKQMSLENRVANWQRNNEERWNTRLKDVEEQLGAVSLALGLKKFGE